MSTDYTLLDKITRRALEFFDVRQNTRRVFRVILDYSFAVGQPAARFTSQRLIHLETGLTKNRVSEALADLVSSRLAQRDGHGKVALTITPLPDWWRWACPVISPAYTEKDFLASLIGYHVTDLVAGWTISPVRAHPVIAHATAYTRGQYDGDQLFPNETTLREEVAAVARAEALTTFVTHEKLMPETPHTPTTPLVSFSDRVAIERAYRETPRNEDELVLMAEKVFPGWESHRRDPFIRSLCKDHRSALYEALSRAQESQQTIRYPWGWLPYVIKEIEQEKHAKNDSSL